MTFLCACAFTGYSIAQAEIEKSEYREFKL